jgi:outer membrane protein OmpA-like peptidoglycan-associated protein
MNIPTKLRTPSVVVTTALTIVLVGCAATPRHDAQLDAARATVATAHNDSRVTGDARAELAKADTALNAGDALLLAGRPLVDVEHQAYLADRYALAAQEHGKLLASEKAIAELDSRRNAVLLAARERDVRRANALAESRSMEASDARSDARRANAIADSSSLDASAARADTRRANADADSSSQDASAARLDAIRANANADTSSQQASEAVLEARRANANADSSAQQASAARLDASASARDSATANQRAERLELQLAELQARHTDRGVVVTLGDVLFATGRSELQRASHRSIGKLTAFLAAHPQRTVRVEGFTDNLGSAGYNRNLSEQRAASVTDALTHGGVDRSRIQTEGYGKAFPVADNDTATGRQQNRRVEVIISDNDERVPERVAESIR